MGNVGFSGSIVDILCNYEFNAGEYDMENRYRLANIFGDESGQFSSTSKFIIIAALVLGVLMLITLTVNALSKTGFAGDPISNLVSDLMGTI